METNCVLSRVYKRVVKPQMETLNEDLHHPFKFGPVLAFLRPLGFGSILALTFGKRIVMTLKVM